MGLIKINHNPSGRQLALFGLLWLLFLGTFGLVMGSRNGWPPVAIGICTAAVLVPLIGLVVPGLLRRVYVAMSYLAFPIGFVVSHVLLAIAYYAVLTPTGLLMRAFGYDPMNRRFDPQADSYWTPREANRDAGHYFRQA